MHFKQSRRYLFAEWRIPLKILDKIVNIPFIVWWAFLCLICIQRLYLMIRSFTGIRCFTFVTFGPWLQIGVDECMFRVYQITSLGPGSATGKRSSPMFNSLRSLFFFLSLAHMHFTPFPLSRAWPLVQISPSAPPYSPTPHLLTRANMRMFIGRHWKRRRTNKGKAIFSDPL